MARKYGAVKSADVQGWIVGSHCQRRTATRRARRLLDGARVSRGLAGIACSASAAVTARVLAASA